MPGVQGGSSLTGKLSLAQVTYVHGPHLHTFHIPAKPSTFWGIFPHLNHVFRIHLIILWNHKYYRISLDSHQMSRMSRLIQGTLSRSKDDLFVVVLYTNGACPSGTERKRLRQEMDR